MSTRKSAPRALYSKVSDKLASATDNLTAPVVAELTDAEIAAVTGGIRTG